MKSIFSIWMVLFGFCATAQRFVNSYNTIAEMIASPSLNSVSTNIYVLGYRTPYDGGGGPFVYDKTSTVATNLGTVVKPTLFTGRLLKQYGAEVNILEFGADPTGVSDSTLAMQGALDFCTRPTYGFAKLAGSSSAALSLYCPTGEYNFTNTLINYGVKVRAKLSSSPSGNYNCDTTFRSKHGGAWMKFIYGGTNAVTGLADYRVGGLENVAIIGYSETYQQNKKAILNVASRTVFTVDPGDIPTLDVIEPTVNWCFFYSDEGQYLGAGQILAADSGTGVVTLSSGTDVYASVGGLLRTVDKVVFSPWMTNGECSVGCAISGYSDPGAAGASGVYIQNAYTGFAVPPMLNHVYIDGFHTGIRFGPGILEGRFQNLKMFQNRFADVTMSREQNSTDNAWTGFTYMSGFYRSDYDVTYANTLQDINLHNCTFGFFGFGPAQRAANLLSEWHAYAQVYIFRSTMQSFGDLFLDGCIRHGLLIDKGYSSGGVLDRNVRVSQLEVQTTFYSASPSRTSLDAIHPTDRYAVKINNTGYTTPAKLSVGNFGVNNLGSGEFQAAFYIPAGYGNDVQISQITSRNGATTNWYSGQAPRITGVASSLLTELELLNGVQNPAANIMSMVVQGTNAVYATTTNVAVRAKSGAFPLSIIRDTGAQFDFGVGVGTFYTRSADLDQYSTALLGSASAMSMYVGSPFATIAPRTVQLSGEVIAAGVLTNSPPGDFYINGSRGSGTNTSAGRLIFTTPATTAADGTAIQTGIARFYVKREGQISLVPLPDHPTVGLANGDVYADSVIGQIRYYQGGLWGTLGQPNQIGAVILNLEVPPAPAVVTISIASPAVVTLAAHGLVAGNPVTFSTSGTLPIGVGDHKVYYVSATGLNLDDFQLASQFGGASINTSGSQSGTHTIAPRGPTTTLTAGQYGNCVILTAVLTGDKTFTPATTSAQLGTKWHCVRSAVSTGAFNWSIGGLKNLTPGTWCEVEWAGTGLGYLLTKYGAL